VSGPPAGYSLDFDPTDSSGTSIFTVADPGLTFCLDYLSSPTADDMIAIQRTPDGLLQALSANADDKSLQIASALIDVARLGAVAAGGNRSLTINPGGTNAQPILVHFEMDPFDQAEAAAINQSLKDFGYCVYVRGWTFSPQISPEAYCRNPRSALAYSPMYTKAPPPAVLVAAAQHGILYRANQIHEVVVMNKPDPKGPGRWRRIHSYAVEMPNVSPIFSVGVDRAFFAKRTTLLRFDSGVLKDVELTKGSELDAISQIPLQIVQAVVSVPTEIIQLRISNVDNERALIDAQAQLINSMRALQTAQQNAPPANTGLDDQRSQQLQNCVDTSSSPATTCLGAISGAPQ